MAISAPGVGSNLDVNSIVTQLMQIEQRPLLLLDQQESSFQARLSSLGSLKSALATLQSASRSLGSVNSAAFKASSSDSSAVSASASSAALPGTHSVSVTALAQSQKLVAGGQASTVAAIGSGSTTTLDFSYGTISGGSFASGTYTGANFAANSAKAGFTVTIDSSNNTLEGIRDAINAADGGVTASIVNDGSGTPYRLALSVEDTGAASSLKIDVSGEAAISSLVSYDPEGTQQLSQTQAAQNAALSVDGTAISSASNTVSEAIQGVTLNVAKLTASPLSITVARDYGTASATLAALVTAYNGANSAIAAATAKGAVQQGDGAVLAIQQRLRFALGNSYSSIGTFRTLSSLGVSFQRDGSLTFDPAKLSAGLAANPTGTLATLAGAAKAVQAVADAALGERGAIQSGTASINASIRNIDARRDDIVRHLTTVERNFRAQFTALDVLVGNMRKTSDFLTQQLANLANISNK